MLDNEVLDYGAQLDSATKPLLPPMTIPTSQLQPLPNHLLHHPKLPLTLVLPKLARNPKSTSRPSPASPKTWLQKPCLKPPPPSSSDTTTSCFGPYTRPPITTPNPAQLSFNALKKERAKLESTLNTQSAIANYPIPKGPKADREGKWGTERGRRTVGKRWERKGLTLETKNRVLSLCCVMGRRRWIHKTWSL